MSTPSSLYLFPADVNHRDQNYEDHHEQHLILKSTSNCPLLSQAASSSSSSSSPSVFFNPPVLLQDHRGKHDDYKVQLKQHHQLLKVNEYHISEHSCESFDFPSGPSLPSIMEKNTDDQCYHELKLSVFDQEDDHQNDNIKGTINQSDGGLVVLHDQMVAPPKIRLLKKMNSMLSEVKPVPARSDTQIRFQDHHHQRQPSASLMSHKNISSSNPTNNYNTTIRVCSDCNTTKTPLWRSGPRGPKSLCNACGIRQRKARRAMVVAAAAAATSTIDLNTTSSKVQLCKEKKLMNKATGYVAQCKKACKFSATTTAAGTSRSRDLCLENIPINLSKNSDIHGVFPQDEKEAAILLMALSCGS